MSRNVTKIHVHKQALQMQIQNINFIFFGYFILKQNTSIANTNTKSILIAHVCC